MCLGINCGPQLAPHYLDDVTNDFIGGKLLAPACICRLNRREEVRMTHIIHQHT